MTSTLTSTCCYCGETIFLNSGGFWVHLNNGSMSSDTPFSHYAFKDINTAPLNRPLINFYPGQLLPVEPGSINVFETGSSQLPNFVIKYQKYPQALLEEKPEPKISKVEKVVEPTGRKFRTEE